MAGRLDSVPQRIATLLGMVALVSLSVSSCQLPPPTPTSQVSTYAGPTSIPTRTPKPTLQPTSTRIPTRPTRTPTLQATTHLVQKGETLSGIARKYGVAVDELVAWNDIKNPDLIHVGQSLVVKPSTKDKGHPISPPGTANIVISYIFYDGVVKRVESDEYAQITNNGSAPVNLKGYRLNAGDPGQDFWFPDFAIGPGQSCRVYTNEYHPESCGFSFGSGRAIWNNKGDCGYLYDATGTVVSEYCY